MFLKYFYKKIKTCFVFLVFSFLFFNLFIISSRSDEIDASIAISPNFQNVSIGENFIVNIFCNPIAPIKAFEFALIFNASLVQAYSVEEGNIFEGFNTFFNPGIINNTQGSVINVYGLIIGNGNVTNPGTLATIYFNATSNIGTSYLNLVNAGVTNETMYLSISTNNGSVSVNNFQDFHILSNESPVNNSYNVFIDTSILSVDVKDPEGDPFYWEITTSPFVGNNSGFCSNNSTITCYVSNLAYLTTYTWFVKCKDLTTDYWTNKTYVFTTKSSVNKIQNGGGGFPPISEQNESNPPSKPLTPSGPVFIEKGVVYQYSSVSFDVDDEKIRYMFDWGDGSFSNWSEFMSSNATIYMNHSWDFVSSFKIRVIAQDEKGLNSSWSDPLEVIVSEIEGVEKTVVLKIDVTRDFNVSNNTFIFDASKSIVFNATIINYTWDFGDGQYGYGEKTVHTYDFSKEYNVILIAKDVNGNSYYENFILNTFSGATEDIDGKTDYEDFGIGFYVFVSIPVFVVILFIIIFREKIEIRLLNYKINKIRKSKK